MAQRLAIVAALVSAFLLLTAPPATAGFVTRSGTHLMLDGQPFLFSGFNIYNANSRGECWYDMVNGTVLDDSLTAIGPRKKVFRAWFHQSFATTGGLRDWTAFDHTLTVARNHGVKVIPTLGTQWPECGAPGGYKDETWYLSGYQQPDPAGTTSYRNFVSEVVTRYKDDDTILAWQLMNEAEVKPYAESGTCSTNASVILKAFAADVSGLVKSIDPNHLVSLGTIGTGQCGAANDEYLDVHSVPTIDLCEYHDYHEANAPMPGDQWNGLQVRINQCNLLNKPLFVGETGIKPTEVSGGTYQDRADSFAAKLWAQFSAGVVGELVWAWSAEGSKINDYDVGPGDPVISVLDGADLSITNSDSPDPVSVGERLTHTLDVTNNGTSSSTEVTVADLLPRGVRFRSARSDHGNCRLRSLRRIICNLAELQGGETATVTIVVRPTRKGTIVNTATVSRTQPPDFVLTDNTATATTEVTP